MGADILLGHHSPPYVFFALPSNPARDLVYGRILGRRGRGDGDRDGYERASLRSLETEHTDWIEWAIPT